MPEKPVIAIQPGVYCSFLVRLWQEHAQGAWRASAQHVRTGETIRFADLMALFAFLQEQTDLLDCVNSVPPGNASSSEPIDQAGSTPY